MYQQCLLALLLLSGLAACKKKEEDTCNYKATVIFNCSPGVGGSYKAYIDGIEVREFYAGETALFQQDTGYHILSVKGGTPYISFEDTVRLLPCSTAAFKFP